jgi:nicotinamide-nucleotide amidase
VPREMYRMWQDTAVPKLKSIGWGQQPIYSRSLRFFGIAESALAERVGDLLDGTNPTVAPYAGDGQVRLRVAARAATADAAAAIIEPVVAKIKAIAGMNYYGSDDDTLASVVGDLLQQNSQTLSVAESCTGGGLGHYITSTPGSSAYFMGGAIAYDNRVKINLLGVNPADLEREGAVSETVARQMALGIKQKLGTDWGVSITGVAGPGGGTEAKPVGLVYFGIAGPQNQTIAIKKQWGSQREREFIRTIAKYQALDSLRRQLLADIPS